LAEKSILCLAGGVLKREAGWVWRATCNAVFYFLR